MAKLIEEEGRSFGDPEDLQSQLSEYLKVKSVIDSMEKRSKELREKIMEHFDADGVEAIEDDKGNIHLYLDNDVDGVVRLEKQRRVTRKLNEDIAEGIIIKHGLEDDLYELKRVVKEDALMAAFYEEKITEDELDEMYPATVVWALRTLKS
jgi:NurA-like 5'-3' nuclease